MEIINKEYIKFQCIEARQPIGTMYIGVINHEDLVTISYADVRRLRNGSDNREIEDYIGIQRQLNESREREIGRYVNLVDATFPNSIILAISSEFANFNKESKEMEILFKDDVAKVLDGQHRIAGLQHFEKSGEEFECVVTIYIDMDIEDQAIVFSTINKEQKSVSNSLAADLFAFSKSKSPQRTAHNIVRALNKKEGGPFYKKIKILGTAVDKERETITQDTFVKNLLKYISTSPQLDRDFYKRNPKSSLDRLYGKEAQKLFLRNIFIDDDTDVKIAQIIFNYFSAVQKKWPTAWDSVAPNMILNKSTGFIALMRFFKLVYQSFNKPDQIVSKEEFETVFEKIEMQESEFNKEKYLPGSSGQGALYSDFVIKSGLLEEK